MVEGYRSGLCLGRVCVCVCAFGELRGFFVCVWDCFGVGLPSEEEERRKVAEQSVANRIVMRSCIVRIYKKRI